MNDRICSYILVIEYKKKLDKTLTNRFYMPIAPLIKFPSLIVFILSFCSVVTNLRKRPLFTFNKFQCWKIFFRSMAMKSKAS